MSAVSIKGWCPDAWHPMLAGDGLLVRVRPRLGRLTKAQVLGLCDVAIAYGNGQIDMTSRANLQLRGFREGDWRAAIEALVALDLVDADPVIETRRAMLVAPDWCAGDDTQRIADALMARLRELPDLPAKMGFAIDAGDAPVLNAASADFRIERGQSGGLILRADGRETGVVLPQGAEVDALIALAQWFVDSGGTVAGRMARHHAALPDSLPDSLPDWAGGAERPRSPGLSLMPGQHPLGSAYGLPFGRIDAHALAAAMTASGAQAMRITPWRVLLLEGGAHDSPLPFRGGAGGGGSPLSSAPLSSAPLSPAPLSPASGEGPHPNPSPEGEGLSGSLVSDRTDPALRTDACPGQPACPQATVVTRDLALRLAPHITGRLHVSGCAKGCARARPADVMLTGRNGRFDLAFDARAGDPPVASGLTPAQILARFESRAMLHSYETDGAAIYRQSFATIRAEADLARFDADEEPVAVRMIHATGMIELASQIRFSPGFARIARAALASGAPILCDARMVSEGITRARLPADNPVICTLHEPEVPAMARTIGNTRSAAALALWRPYLAGAVVAIGNAPTALFHLLNMLADPDCPRPAAIIGCPVGFVGAMESKAALWAAPPVPCCIVEGRLGGSAITVAAINALASRTE